MSEKAKKQNRNLKTLTEVIYLISNSITLPIEYKDHKLIGNYIGRRECHIGTNFLLIYCIKKDILTFKRLGNYSELFK